MANTFALLLTITTFVTGIIWIYDKIKLAPTRHKKRAEFQEQSEETLSEKALDAFVPENILIENARSLFPVIAIVFVLRSFLYEPFQIPSGSMMPTLLDGDFILVEKFSFGIKEPIWQTTLIPMGAVKRGDVAVFKYPEDTRVDFIKRVVGLPGDKLVYKDKQLYLIPRCEAEPCSDKYHAVEMTFLEEKQFYDESDPMNVYKETLGEVEHKLLLNPLSIDNTAYYFKQEGTYHYEWTIPEGNYFLMGDNRDNSKDSRYWGFVPEKNLVGKAVAIWISFEFYREESSLLPKWVPSGIRFNRIGGIT